MTDFIILSVAFGKEYILQQDRLQKSINKTHVDAVFYAWINEYPPGSLTHNRSLYGFKVWAVKWALNKGFKKIIWLDTACILQHPVDYWYSLNLPVIAAKDDNALSKTICDKSLNYYDNPDITGMHLVGGSIYAFDFDHPDCQKIFDHWAKAEADGVFGSQAEQASGKINGHRHDESAMSMALYQNGYEPVPCDVMRYNQDENSIVRKYHFK